MLTLSAARIRILRGGRTHPGIDKGQTPVVRPAMVGGYEAVTEKRNIQWLVSNGYLEPSLHGDWYVTDKGKAVISEGVSE